MQLTLAFHCPVCEGRTADPLSALEDRCPAHGGPFVGPSDAELRALMKRLERERLESLRLHRQAVARALADPTMLF